LVIGNQVEFDDSYDSSRQDVGDEGTVTRITSEHGCAVIVKPLEEAKNFVLGATIDPANVAE
jgi:hypothetical protein